MCISIFNKWKQFEPTAEYLKAIKPLTSIAKLSVYIKRFKYVADKKDKWQTPVETFERGKGDCEDFARFTLDVLVRIQKREDVRFIIYTGYYNEKKYGAHAVCVFPYRNTYSVFSNTHLYTYKDNYIDIGHIFYPKLKYMEVRNDEGKIISRKFKLWGSF